MDINMADNYYERLGVENDADGQQIKRAYYTMVKKYPPERFPEEYKALRAAYEVISDSKKRGSYDRTRALPDAALRLYEQAQAMERTNRRPQAIEIYNQILALYPDLSQVQLSLARAYEETDKPGKAAAMWEKLCDGEPENAEYSHELALAYDHRGWRKKAVTRYKRALELDDSRAAYWMALINCLIETHRHAEAQMVCEAALRAMEKHGKASVRLLANAFSFKVREGDDAAAERYLEKIVHVMRTGGEPDRNLEDAVYLLLESASKQDKRQYIKHICEMAAFVPNISDELRGLLDDASISVRLTALKNGGMPDLILELLARVHEDCDCEECVAMRAAVERHILADIKVLRPFVVRLKAETPDLYAMHSGFFDMAISGQDIQKEIFRRKKMMDKSGIQFTYKGIVVNDETYVHDDSSESAQQVRSGPKVGRNDPCPCGSGKKYKHCCGK